MIPMEYLVQRGVLALPTDTAAHSAARRMCERAVGCVLVNGQKGELIGIITDRDPSCLALGKLRDTDVPLSRVMTPRPLFVERTADLEQVIHLIVKHFFDALQSLLPPGQFYALDFGSMARLSQAQKGKAA